MGGVSARVVKAGVPVTVRETIIIGPKTTTARGTRYLSLADIYLRRLPQNGFDAYGNPLQCRASTRKGTPCQRVPLPHNGYCPSHQHLAETEDRELAAA